MSSDLWVLRHQAPPVRVKKRAKLFPGVRLCGSRRRVLIRLRRIFCLAKSEQWQHEHCTADSDCECDEHADHYGFLPAAAVASSLSRSRASITISRPVSAASIA